MKRDDFFFISILLIKHQAPVFQHSQCLKKKKKPCCTQHTYSRLKNMKVLNVFFTWCTVDQINSFIFNIWSKSTKYWILASNVIKEELRRHNVFLLISSNNKENVNFYVACRCPMCLIFYYNRG